MTIFGTTRPFTSPRVTVKPDATTNENPAGCQCDWRDHWGPTPLRGRPASFERPVVHPIKGWSQHRHMLRNRKGSDMSEWPESLRVREFPVAQGRAAE